MEWLTSVLTYILGFLTSVFLQKRSERRESEKALSREVYRPLHEELAQTSSRVERRLYCDNPAVWLKTEASGLAGKIDTSTRKKLQHLYGVTVPCYQAALMGASQEWEQLRKKWDSLYGSGLPEGYNRRDFDWWNFLLAEECSGTGIVIGTVEGMKIYSAYLTAERLVSGLSLEEFLRDRWNEATGSPRFATYRAARRETLREIKDVMEHLVCRMRV